MTTPSQSIYQAYGYLWWLNGQPSYRLPRSQFTFPGSMVPAGPADCIMAIGKNGQVVCVVPSQNLVWVRMGDTPGTALVPQLPVDTIWQKINQLVCTPLSTTAPPTAHHLTVFPNPSHGQVVVQSSTAIDHLVVYNGLGQLVAHHRAKGAKVVELDLQHHPKGNYSIRTIDADGRVDVRQWTHW